MDSDKMDHQVAQLGDHDQSPALDGQVGSLEVGKGFDLQAFEAARSIASRQAQRLQELKKELKLHHEQLKDILESDRDLVMAEEAAKEVNQKAKVRKTELLETTEAKNIKLKITDLKEEQTDVEESLSNHLFDLYQTTGVMEFEDQEGNIWEYAIKAKVKGKRAS